MKTLKIDELCDIIGEYYKEIHDKSPFMSIISDIKSILPKKKTKKKIAEIKDIVKSLLLNKKEKIKKIEKIININKKDVYKPIKIYGAFDDDFTEYKSDSNKDKSIAKYLCNIRGHLKRL